MSHRKRPRRRTGHRWGRGKRSSSVCFGLGTGGERTATRRPRFGLERIEHRCDLIAAFVFRHLDYHSFRIVVANDVELTPTEREDVAIANALLDAERSLLDSQWSALQALLSLIPPGGDLSELWHLPDQQVVRAVRLLYACGWRWDVPDE